MIFKGNDVIIYQVVDKRFSMRNFSFYNPVRVHFGAGVIENIGKEINKIANKVCLVSYEDLAFIQHIVDRVEGTLVEEGVEVIRFYNVEENPDSKTLDTGVQLCKEKDVDLVIGVGGGSAMDAAKAIAAGVYYEGSVWDMVYNRHDDVTTCPPEKALPIVLVPTLPATGSEMNQCAVVSNRALFEKSYIWSECLYATSAFIDPELTKGLPTSLTANAAADAFSHVLEIYINGEEDSALPHYFQEGVMRTIIENVHIALAEPSNIEARTNLQWASTCAINGWASPSDAWTPIHQVAHNLTSLHGVAHGSSLTALMPAWMESFWERRERRYYDFATRVMDIPEDLNNKKAVILKGISKFRDFLAEIGTPVTLAELNIRTSDIPHIVSGVEKVSFNSEGVLSCIPDLTKADIEMMLHNAKPLK